VTRLRLLAARLASVFTASRMDRDLDDEIADHIARATADHVAHGMPTAAARTAALAEFGSVLATRDAHADLRGVPWLENVWRDARHALRGHLKTPLFAVVVVATLGLGIGATSAIFGLVNAVVLRPLPYPESDRLVKMSQAKRESGEAASVSPPNFFDLREQVSAFSGMAAYWSPAMRLADVGGLPERVLGTVATANLFEVLGVRPLAGRAFAASDDVPGAARVALVSHGLWRRRFGADPAVVGRKVLVDDAPVVIVGVMPEGFGFPARTDLWLPIRLSRTEPPTRAIPPERYRRYRILSVVARLGAGKTIADARADVAGVFGRLVQQYPDANRDMTATAVALHESVVGDVRPAMLLLFAAVGCLLIIASANVATLLAVRTASRERDLTLRLALGAGRARIVQQMLVDSLLLGLAGGVAGLLVARAFLGVMLRVAPPAIPRIETARIDPSVVLFTFAVAIVSSLLFGMAPAIHASRRALVDALKSGARATATSGQQRLRRGLVVAEIALSMLLLVTAGLLAQTLVRLGRVELGFRPASVLTLDRLEMPRGATPALSAAFFDELVGDLSRARGIDAAGLTIGVPLDPRGRFFVDESPFDVEGREPSAPADRPVARLQVVTGGFFAALGVPMLAGRSFDRDAQDSPPVAIVNRALAERYFPRGDAIGHVITHDLSIVPGQPTRRRIVGVVDNVRQFHLDEPFEPELFVPHAQMPWPAMALVMRTPLGADAVAATVRDAVRRLNPGVIVPAPAEMARAQDEALGQPRLRAWLLAVFAATALLLASIGLYGTIAFAIHQRRSELAIRLVLGATPGQTRGLVMHDGLVLAAGGTALGAVAAFVLTRLLSTLLFGVGAFDAATVGVVAGLLFGVSALASYLPARRVHRLDALAAINATE
jgi:putative ABC transport system permease protein